MMKWFLGKLITKFDIEVTAQRRASALLVDQLISIIILFVASFVLTGDIFGYGDHLGVIIPMLLLVFRDIFGKSIGKVLLGLEIIDIRTGKTATLGQRLLKNITTPLTVIEIVILLCKKENLRLGDKLAKTEIRMISQNNGD